MPRPRIRRRIFFNPNITEFKPIGIPFSQIQEIILTKTELEAVRLIDYEFHSQNKVAKEMKISQPTLSRLLTSARRKIADALVNGKAIKIEGGVYKMVQSTSRGMGLGAGRGRRQGRMGGAAAGPGGVCKCPKCGYEEIQVRGKPCMNKKCPKCESSMIRG